MVEHEHFCSMANIFNENGWNIGPMETEHHDHSIILKLNDLEIFRNEENGDPCTDFEGYMEEIVDLLLDSNFWIKVCKTDNIEEEPFSSKEEIIDYFTGYFNYED